jgi:uncharacterized Zn-finger protein
MSKEDEKEYYWYLSSKLKTLTVETLEKAIAKVVGEMLDEKLSCSIQNINYEHPHVTINMTLDREFEVGGFIK